MSAHSAEPWSSLGEQIGTYRPVRLSAKLAAWAIVLSVLLVIAVLPRLGSASTWEWTLGLLTLGAPLGWLCWIVPQRCVRVYQNGLVVCRGNQQRHVLWCQIREVYQAPLTRPTRILPEQSASPAWLIRLVGRDGQTLRLHSFEPMSELAAHVQQQVAERHLPRSLHAFHAGYSVWFGRRLSISTSGIQLRHDFVPWHRIARVEIDDGEEVRVVRTNPRAATLRIASSRVSNLRLLGAVLRSIKEELEIRADEIDLQRSAFRDAAGSGLLDLTHADTSDLLAAGFDWEDIRQVHAGRLSLEELIDRGPRRPPRHPR
jgi:hypothetical protein